MEMAEQRRFVDAGSFRYFTRGGSPRSVPLEDFARRHEDSLARRRHLERRALSQHYVRPPAIFRTPPARFGRLRFWTGPSPGSATILKTWSSPLTPSSPT